MKCIKYEKKKKIHRWSETSDYNRSFERHISAAETGDIIGGLTDYTQLCRAPVRAEHQHRSCA